jgi:hypothetical protein
MRLTWEDLLIQPDAFDWPAVLGEWSDFVTGRVRPVFLNRFGGWFLERASGEVICFDILSGDIEVMAPSRDAFTAEVNRQAWQEALLCSKLVAQLHQHGMKPGPAECYAINPHPAIGGPNPWSVDTIDPARVQVMSVRVWQSLCRQILGGPA